MSRNSVVQVRKHFGAMIGSGVTNMTPFRVLTIRMQVFTNVDFGVVWTLFFIYTWFAHLDGRVSRRGKSTY